MDLSIRAIETSKDEIKQPKLVEDPMYIPPLGSSVIISGKSGSGKSTLLANLITDDRFYKGWFDKIFVFSPTANGDDVQKALGVPANNVFTDLDEAPQVLDLILDTQQTKLDKAAGAHKVPQYCIIFDDVIGNTQFLNDKAFMRCFYQVRHVNCTTFVCTQHFKRVPRVCRLQANFIFFFQGSQSEVEMMAEEFAPPIMSKREFMHMVTTVTAEPFSFLTINMKVHWGTRFRKNLNKMIVLRGSSKLYGSDAKEENAGRIKDEKTGGSGEPSPGESGTRTDGGRGGEVRRNRNRAREDPRAFCVEGKRSSTKPNFFHKARNKT